MNLVLKTLGSEEECAAWDGYVASRPESNLYHLSGWKTVIKNAYGHPAYYLMAVRHKAVAGILPLIHMKHFLFGERLVSVPYFDMGGILADSAEVEGALLAAALKLGTELKATEFDLRHAGPLSCLSGSDGSPREKDPAADRPPASQAAGLPGGFLSRHSDIPPSTPFFSSSRKARMILDLPQSSEALMAGFKSKLRSQIRRPLKDGLTTEIGGKNLLDDFYSVFCSNMRDLGSPVHSKKLLKSVLDEYSHTAKLVMIYKDTTAVAAGLILGFKDTVANPWASSLKSYSRSAPNMLLYWAMLEYACDNGFKKFDFGRSTPGEGTYRFKTQWGARPSPLDWYTFHLNRNSLPHPVQSEKSKFGNAIDYWKMLPVPMTRALGPMIRKHISL